MKIVSYSLWGNDPKYTIGAIRNAEMCREYYPDWTARFYVGKSVPTDIISSLKGFDNTEVVLMEQEGDWTGMFWRFAAADGDEVVLSRDTDCRPSWREVKAVDAWLNSDKDFHIMRDHPYHGTEILGGMWGARNGILRGISQKISEYNKGNFWQVDQNFLRSVVYPLVRDRTLVHDEIFERKPFPTPRQSREFVGKAFNADDTEFEPKHGDILK
jgi:protein O-GlcNAc transferase